MGLLSMRSGNRFVLARCQTCHETDFAPEVNVAKLFLTHQSAWGQYYVCDKCLEKARLTPAQHAINCLLTGETAAQARAELTLPPARVHEHIRAVNAK